MREKNKIIRAATVAQSCNFFRDVMIDMRERGYNMIALSSPGHQLDSIEDCGFHIIPISMERHISLKKDVVSLFKLIKVFRRERPQMVHSMTPKAGLLCMVAAWLTRVPVRVHTFTGLVFPTAQGLKRKILMLTDAITCACATHIIPEGEGVKADLQNNGITKKPMKILGYGNVRGIDMTRFSRRESIMRMAENLRDSDVFTFLFVGRIVRDKGINELVAAFKRLNEEFHKTRLWLVGHYENELDPISISSQEIINESQNINTLGTILGDELIAYYAASDCFVFPSYREGFPNTVIEAGAMDLPCIVTDINGSREIISQGENGIIIPSKNEEQLYKAMKQMITDENSRKKMSGNARKMIADRFEQSFVRQCLYDYYDEILPHR